MKIKASYRISVAQIRSMQLKESKVLEICSLNLKGKLAQELCKFAQITENPPISTWGDKFCVGIPDFREFESTLHVLTVEEFSVLQSKLSLIRSCVRGDSYLESVIKQIQSILSGDWNKENLAKKSNEEDNPTQPDQNPYPIDRDGSTD